MRDDRLYEELGAAIVREMPSGKKKCDHTGNGSLDGVICMGIALYIAEESPDSFVCRVFKKDAEDRRENSLMSRLRRQASGEGPDARQHRPMGSGVAGMGESRRFL